MYPAFLVLTSLSLFIQYSVTDPRFLGLTDPFVRGTVRIQILIRKGLDHQMDWAFVHIYGQIKS
jgi:hypothetical protein